MVTSWIFGRKKLPANARHLPLPSPALTHQDTGLSRSLTSWICSTPKGHAFLDLLLFGISRAGWPRRPISNPWLLEMASVLNCVPSAMAWPKDVQLPSKWPQIMQIQDPSQREIPGYPLFMKVATRPGHWWLLPCSFFEGNTVIWKDIKLNTAATFRSARFWYVRFSPHDDAARHCRCMRTARLHHLTHDSGFLAELEISQWCSMMSIEICHWYPEIASSWLWNLYWWWHPPPDTWHHNRLKKQTANMKHLKSLYTSLESVSCIWTALWITKKVVLYSYMFFMCTYEFCCMATSHKHFLYSKQNQRQMRWFPAGERPYGTVIWTLAVSGSFEPRLEPLRMWSQYFMNFNSPPSQRKQACQNQRPWTEKGWKLIGNTKCEPESKLNNLPKSWY